MATAKKKPPAKKGGRKKSAAKTTSRETEYWMYSEIKDGETLKLLGETYGKNADNAIDNFLADSESDEDGGNPHAGETLVPIAKRVYVATEIEEEIKRKLNKKKKDK